MHTPASTDTPATPPVTTPDQATMIASAASVRRMNRIKATLVFLPFMSVLVVAAVLSPDARGYGTHEKLGLPPCGFKSTLGMPCATCGMTTSFAHAAHGDLIASFQNQPMGAVLAVLCAVLAIIGAYGMVTGAPLQPLWGRIVTARNVIVFGVLMLAAWGYKIFLTMNGMG